MFDAGARKASNTGVGDGKSISATHIGRMSRPWYRRHLRLSVSRLSGTVSKSKLISTPSPVFESVLADHRTYVHKPTDATWYHLQSQTAMPFTSGVCGMQET